jgi:hypothetical protein
MVGMDDATRQMLDGVVNALERFWLRQQAAEHILKQCEIPDWEKLVREYCDLSANKRLAQKRFAGARALIQLAQMDSALVKALGQTSEPN